MMGMKRGLLAVAMSVVLLVASACAAPGSALATPTPTSSVPPTQVIQYVPAVPSGAEQQGRCWTSSLAVARDDAWRCMVGNEIFDPCFAVSSAQTIVCDADPATNKPGFVLKLTEPLPAPDVPAQVKQSYQGWLVQLSDGTICSYATGATTGVNGERVNYLCSDKWGLLGDLHPGRVWTADKVIIEVGPNGPTLKQSETVTIRTVWQ
jgi:hypothetical protein